MKKYNSRGNPQKKSRHKTKEDIIDEVNAASMTDFTGLIPSAPKYEYEEEAYEEIYPTGMPSDEVTHIEN